MEYILGSLITIATIYLARKVYLKSADIDTSIRLSYSQAHLFSIMKPFLGDISRIQKPLKSQVTAYEASRHVRVILESGKAYWIIDNTFFEADEKDGFIYKDSAKPVDIMGMDKVQLDKMITIVEALTEGGDNENWHSGK